MGWPDARDQAPQCRIRESWPTTRRSDPLWAVFGPVRASRRAKLVPRGRRVRRAHRTAHARHVVAPRDGHADAREQGLQEPAVLPVAPERRHRDDVTVAAPPGRWAFPYHSGSRRAPPRRRTRVPTDAAVRPRRDRLGRARRSRVSPEAWLDLGQSIPIGTYEPVRILHQEVGDRGGIDPAHRAEHARDVGVTGRKPQDDLPALTRIGFSLVHQVDRGLGRPKR